MKKSLSILLALVMVLSVFTGISFNVTAGEINIAKSAESYGDFQYYVSQSKASITKYNGSGGAVNIPSNINGYTVDEIYSYAFSDCTSVTSVVIPNTVTYIDSGAFNGCKGLKSINIPNSVTHINEMAFLNCSALSSIDIPDSLKRISTYTFCGCTGLKSVTIGNSVSEIGAMAFGECTGLKSVTIGNSVTEIDARAFYNCTELTSLVIPNSVTSIYGNAFEGCSGFESIKVSNANTVYDSRNNCNALIETKTNKLLFGCMNTIIPYSVTSISDVAFIDCTGLTNVVIPNSVENIGKEAFSGCSGLRNLVIPDSVTNIGRDAFFGCTGLMSIFIGKSVVTESIRELFYSCTGLTSIEVSNDNPVYDSRNNCNAVINTESNTLVFGCQSTVIPDSVNEIASYAFKDCEGLTSINIPDTVDEIGVYAFCDCTGLTSINISNSARYIGYHTFHGCTALTSIDIPDSVEGIGEYAFSECTGLTDVVIGDSVTEIVNHAFSGCSALKSIVIGDSVESMENYIFEDCPELTSIKVSEGNSVFDSRNNCNAIIHTKSNALIFGCKNTIVPNSVKSISSEAFNGCAGLTSIDIPDSVTFIDYFAFYNCTRLKSVVIPDSVTSINDFSLGYYDDDITQERKKVVGFVIYGYNDSEAERYAKNNGFTFVSLGSVLKDEATNITLIGNIGDATLDVSVLDINSIALPSNFGKIISAYDIRLMKDGEDVQPEGEVTVKIPCNIENARIFRQEANGTFTDMNAHYENGFLVFTTSHFSTYTVFSSTESTPILLGDTDGDGSVTVVDATFIQRKLASLEIPFVFNDMIADTDGDGSVTVIDATFIQRWLASLPSNENIGKPIA